MGGGAHLWDTVLGAPARLTGDGRRLVARFRLTADERLTHLDDAAIPSVGPRFLALLVGTAALSAGLLAAMGAPLAPRLVIEITAAAIAAFCCTRAAPHHEGRMRTAWALIGGGAAVYAVGRLMTAPGGTLEPARVTALDVSVVVGAMMAIAGLALLASRPDRMLTQIRVGVEGFMIGGCVLFVGWGRMFGPAYEDAAGSSAVVRTLVLAQPLLQLVAIALLVSLTTRVSADRVRWWLPLAAGLGAVVVVDIAVGRTSRADVGLGLAMIGVVAGFALVAVAATRSWGPQEDQPLHAHVQRLMTAVPSLGALGVLVGAVAHRSGAQQLDPVIEWIAVGVLCLSVALHVVVILESDQLSTELSTAHDDAIQASVTKSHFLATVSHEIRTPMNAVIGLTGLLLDSELDEEQRELAVGVAISAEGLLGLINDLLDFSKIEAERMDLEEIDLDLEDLVDEVGMIVADAAHKKGLYLLAYCEPELETRRRGDPLRIRQILLNLASNAVKFTENGMVVVRARPHPKDSERVIFEVTDTGIGIAHEDQARLFEPFSQLDGSITREFGGTGLGLAIVRRLTALQGGEVILKSQVGVGSTFRVELPLSHGVQPRVEAALAGLEGLRALVVDKDAVTRSVLAHALHTWGFRVDQAATADVALELFARSTTPGDSYAIVLIEDNPEGMDGSALGRVLRVQDPANPPVVFILTADPSLSRRAAHEAGIDSVLLKPVRNTYLLRRIVASLVTDPQPVLAEAGSLKGNNTR